MLLVFSTIQILKEESGKYIHHGADQIQVLLSRKLILFDNVLSSFDVRQDIIILCANTLAYWLGECNLKSVLIKINIKTFVRYQLQIKHT